MKMPCTSWSVDDVGRLTVFDTRCVHVALDGSLDAQMPFGHNVERRDEEASHIVGNASANRLGLREVILPRANEPDLDDLPASVRGAITFHPVGDMEDVLAAALERVE